MTSHSNSSRSHDPSAFALTNVPSLVDHFHAYRTNSPIQLSPCFSLTHFWQSLYALQPLSRASVGEPFPISDMALSPSIRQWHPYAQYFFSSNPFLPVIPCLRQYLI